MLFKELPNYEVKSKLPFGVLKHSYSPRAPIIKYPMYLEEDRDFTYVAEYISIIIKINLNLAGQE